MFFCNIVIKQKYRAALGLSPNNWKIHFYYIPKNCNYAVEISVPKVFSVCISDKVKFVLLLLLS